MTPENINRIIEKVTSGQWILAMSGAFVFAWCAAEGVIDKDTIKELLLLIFMFYFLRKRNGETKQ